MVAKTAKLKTGIRTTSVEFPELAAEVSIRRDDRGIPFIQATNDADLYFAQGYATAADRLWQMDFLRRTARGELAEILGGDALEIDKLHRVYGFRRVAEKLFERASEATRTVLGSYARGVNAFIQTCKTPPLEFQVLGYQPRGWTPVDSLALGKLFAENLSFTVDADILRALMSDLSCEKLAWLLPETSPLDVMPDGQPGNPRSSSAPKVDERKFSEVELELLSGLLKKMRRLRGVTSGDTEVGSNSWVVSGEKTFSGKPMLASDPHLPPASPSIWHIVHLSAGDLRVSGVSVPGIPGVMIGHNQRIAWGMTNLCPDVQDLYIEQLDRLASAHTEEITVRGESQKVSLDVKVTRHGPIVFEQGSLGLALRWTALDAEANDLETFLAINRAPNWNEFVAALKGYGGPPQNFTYADTDGHIGCYSAGRIPIRKTGEGSLPYDGATDDGEWVGVIPFEELPHVFDPQSAAVVQANQRVVNTDYKHHLTKNWRVPYRAHRIQQLLQTKTKLDAGDFLAIQADTYSYPDAIFAAEVVKLGEPLTGASTEWRDLVRQLKDWDGHSNAETTALPLITEIRKAFRNRILTGVLGKDLAQVYEWRNEATFVDKLITERPLEWLPHGFTTYESLLLACYRKATTALSTRFGADAKQWTWGNIADVRFPHPLEKLGSAGAKFATQRFPQNTGGSLPTVNAGSRVSLRFIADLSDWDATRLCLPLGESGDPASRHREDQFDEWRKVSPKFLPFTEDAIANATRETLLLIPTSNDIKC